MGIARAAWQAVTGQKIDYAPPKEAEATPTRPPAPAQRGASTLDQIRRKNRDTKDRITAETE